MKRWEFVQGSEHTVQDGHVVRRIRRIIDGVVGGYVEHESNLEQDSTAWVNYNAYVFGDARVYDNAYVGGNARISDSAQVFENALVYDNARVNGRARVYGHARVYDCAVVRDEARVYGGSEIYGAARVYDNAWVSGSTYLYGTACVGGNALIYDRDLVCWFSGVGSVSGTLTVYACADGTLGATRGCFCGTTEEFLAASARWHDARIKREYELLIEVATSRISYYGKLSGETA